MVLLHVALLQKYMDVLHQRLPLLLKLFFIAPKGRPHDVETYTRISKSNLIQCSKMFKIYCDTQAPLDEERLVTTSTRRHVAFEARFAKPCFDELCFFNSSHTLLQGSSRVERAMDSSTDEA